MRRASRQSGLARTTRHAYEALERLFPSPADASGCEFEAAVLVDELGADLAGGLSRNGISTAALLAADANVRSLESTECLTVPQRLALAAVRECLERWKLPLGS